MSRLEKKFTLSHSIDLSSVTNEPKPTEIETHFSIPWCIKYYASNSCLTLIISCLHEDSEKWEIETEIEFKLKSFNGAYLKLKEEISFGNSKENNQISWAWTELAKLEVIEKRYAENGKFMVEAHLVVKRMSGFGKEKLKYFDASSQKHWDVILNVGGHKFHLLRAFLASQSTYFESLLFGAFNESGQGEVELKGTDLEDFQSFLELIYGEPAVDDTNIDGVLHLADMFDAPTAIRRCEEFLLVQSKWSFDEKVQLAERYHLKKLVIKLQQVSKEDKEEKLEDIAAEPAEQPPNSSWILWFRTGPVLFYLNCFLLFSTLVFTIIIFLC